MKNSTEKTWRIAVMKDSSVPMLGLHGLHTAFRGLPDVEVVAHVDSNLENLAEKMAYTQAKRHYHSYIEMLDQEKPDIVTLCSRHPNDHFQQITEAAQRGIHIYCEKPMTVSLEEAKKIVALTEQYSIKFCMAHPARYALGFRTMKQMIEAGEIGTPLTAHGRGKCDHRGGGEDLTVLGTHILDLQMFMFGKPSYVFADILTDAQPVKKDEFIETVEPIGPTMGNEIFAHYRFPNGVRGSFETRHDLFDDKNPYRHMGLCVVGTTGALSLRFNDIRENAPGLRISKTTAPIEDIAAYEEVELKEVRSITGADPLDYSLTGEKDLPQGTFFVEANRFAAWDLIESITEDRLPISNQYNAQATLALIQGIYDSHLSGTRIQL